MNLKKTPAVHEPDPGDVSLAGESLYPHLKITREEFPRLLATRKIAGDDADYFGAFLPATGLRLWLEFINRTFRLRTCQIPIDGKFPAPCPQFYNRRCLAPCVENLCDRRSYSEMVEIVKLFLRRETEKLAETLTRKIQTAAEDLDFEKAAAWRDILVETRKVFAEKDWQLWLDEAVDTLAVEERQDRVFVYLVTQRGRRTLGRMVFVFSGKARPEEIVPELIRGFYRFHAPREIRLPFDFPARKRLAQELSRRENRSVKITVFAAANQRKTSLQALKRAQLNFELEQLKPAVNISDALRELESLFDLSRPPQKIEAFDAAHISGTDLTAAKIVWANGKFFAAENEFWLLDETGEIEALRRAVGERFRAAEFSFPDLVLIDGGKSQLQAALRAVSFLEKREFAVICAVKPEGRHNEISHFITETGARIEFSNDSEAMRILLRLRDEAHELANRIHRLRRESAHFYKLGSILPSIKEAERRALLQKFGSLGRIAGATVEEIEKLLGAETAEKVFRDLRTNENLPAADAKPLIVPIRYDDPNGDARDLQPLAYQRIAGKRRRVKSKK